MGIDFLPFLVFNVQCVVYMVAYGMTTLNYTVNVPLNIISSVIVHFSKIKIVKKKCQKRKCQRMSNMRSASGSAEVIQKLP